MALVTTSLVRAAHGGPRRRRFSPSGSRPPCGGWRAWTGPRPRLRPREVVPAILDGVTALALFKFIHPVPAGAASITRFWRPRRRQGSRPLRRCVPSRRSRPGPSPGPTKVLIDDRLAVGPAPAVACDLDRTGRALVDGDDLSIGRGAVSADEHPRAEQMRRDRRLFGSTDVFSAASHNANHEGYSMPLAGMQGEAAGGFGLGAGNGQPLGQYQVRPACNEGSERHLDWLVCLHSNSLGSSGSRCYPGCRKLGSRRGNSPLAHRINGLQCRA